MLTGCHRSEPPQQGGFGNDAGGMGPTLTGADGLDRAKTSSSFVDVTMREKRRREQRRLFFFPEVSRKMVTLNKSIPPLYPPNQFQHCTVAELTRAHIFNVDHHKTPRVHLLFAIISAGRSL